jgi:methionine-S-sulfoxide reductase
MQKETIVLGGGCFWCTEAVFQMLKGIISIMPGYAGGTTKNPTYEQVCSGTTGHAESVQVEYDADIISLESILTVFFGSHDPTQLNRQGNDVGTQYRSVIFYTTPEQKLLCDKFIADINNSNEMGNPVVTAVEPLDVFYPAEDYHKDYYKNNPNQGYCQVVINPKLDKVKHKFANLLKTI